MSPPKKILRDNGASCEVTRIAKQGVAPATHTLSAGASGQDLQGIARLNKELIVMVQVPVQLQERSPLLRLPAELRLEVYSLLVEIYEFPKGQRHGGEHVSHSFVIAVLCLNRQINAEATAVFFKNLTLRVDIANQIGHTLRYEPSIRSNFIKKVYLHLSMQSIMDIAEMKFGCNSKKMLKLVADWFEALAEHLTSMGSLEELSLDFQQATGLRWCPTYANVNFRLHEGIMEPLKRINGLKKVSILGNISEGYSNALSKAMIRPRGQSNMNFFTLTPRVKPGLGDYKELEKRAAQRWASRNKGHEVGSLHLARALS